MVLLILFVLTGCARPVRVGMSGDYPPFAYRDPGGCLRGYDVAMAGAWAVDQDRILSVVPFRWPALASDLEAGEFDLAMSGTEASEADVDELVGYLNEVTRVGS